MDAQREFILLAAESVCIYREHIVFFASTDCRVCTNFIDTPHITKVSVCCFSNAVIVYFALMIGQLTIVDHDRIETSNLHRQILYRNDDVGRFKAEVLAESCARYSNQSLIPSLRFDAFP